MSKIKKLEALIINQKVLLHGGPNEYTELLPFLTDGEVAVCATQFPEIAIFMALLKSYPVGGERNFGIQFHTYGNSVSATFTWKLNPTFIHHPLKGYVYVVAKEKFTKKFRSEFRSYERVNFLNYHEVTREDLPFVLDAYEGIRTIELNAALFNAVN